MLGVVAARLRSAASPDESPSLVLHAESASSQAHAFKGFISRRNARSLTLWPTTKHDLFPFQIRSYKNIMREERYEKAFSTAPEAPCLRGFRAHLQQRVSSAALACGSVRLAWPAELCRNSRSKSARPPGSQPRRPVQADVRCTSSREREEIVALNTRRSRGRCLCQRQGNRSRESNRTRTCKTASRIALARRCKLTVGPGLRVGRHPRSVT